MNEMSQNDLELSMLCLYYTYSDQYGHVDIKGVKKFLKEKKAGVTIDIDKFQIQQKHLDLLMDAEMLPDIRLLLDKVTSYKT